MKRKILLLAIFILWLTGVQAQAIIYVPNDGDTGWQTFSFTFPYEFTGSLQFVVSDYGDYSVSSYLLIDNLSTGPSGNTGFEKGDLTGYQSNGTVSVVTNFYNSGNGASYTPTEGSYMALLDSVYGDTGYSTSNLGGYDGSILSWNNVNLSAGYTFTFDWAFATTDYCPYYDFASFIIEGQYSTPSGTTKVFEEYKLAQINPNPVPEPITLILFGSGLIGISSRGLLRKRKFNK